MEEVQPKVYEENNDQNMMKNLDQKPEKIPSKMGVMAVDKCKPIGYTKRIVPWYHHNKQENIDSSIGF